MTTVDEDLLAGLSSETETEACAHDLSESVLTEEVLADVLRQASLVSVRELERAQAKKIRTGFSLREVLLPIIPWGRMRQMLEARVTLPEGRQADLGDVLVQAHWLTREQLTEAQHDQARAGKALAHILLIQGILTPAQFDDATRYQRETGVSFWRTLINLDYVLPVEVTRAFQTYKRFPFLADADGDLAERLVRAGHLDGAAAEDLLAECERTNQTLTARIISLNLVSEESLARTIAEQFGLEFARPDLNRLDPDVVAEFPSAVTVKLQALPIERVGRQLTVMLADPTRAPQVEELAGVLNREVRCVVTTPTLLQETLESWVMGRAASSAGKSDARTLLVSARAQVAEDLGGEGSITALTDAILTGAMSARAMDIHLESQERGLRIRYRIDGFLHDIMNLPRGTAAAVISRLKVMSNLDIAERRRSQDGHLSLDTGGRAIDMRISTVPGYLGEGIVIRIITERTVATGLSQLGLEPPQRNLVDTLMARPRSEEHTSELQSHSFISYAVFCLKKKK